MALFVSLTSTSERLEILQYTLSSLLRQTLAPDKIFLNLSKEARFFDQGIKNLPQWICDLDPERLHVKWVKNTGPYRKFLPTLELASESDIIVTCDDDVIYGKEWLATLIRSKNDHPDKIICGRARIPVKNFYGKTTSYPIWPTLGAGQSSHKAIPIGVSGVVYERRLIDLDFVFSPLAYEIAPMQDDLWFALAAEKAETSIFVATATDQQVFEIGTGSSLAAINRYGTKSKNSPTNLFSRAARILFYYGKAYLGLTVCDNDDALKKIHLYNNAAETTKQ